jgi:hypothetical protein
VTATVQLERASDNTSSAILISSRATSRRPKRSVQTVLCTFEKPSTETGEVGDGLLRPQNKLSQDKKVLYKAALMTAEQEVKLGQAETRDIWSSMRIFFSPDLELSDGRQQAIEAGIIRLGGVVVVHDYCTRLRTRNTNSTYCVTDVRSPPQFILSLASPVRLHFF